MVPLMANYSGNKHLDTDLNNLIFLTRRKEKRCHILTVLCSIWIHRNERLFRGRAASTWSNPPRRGIGHILVFQDMRGVKKFRIDERILIPLPLSIRYMSRSPTFG